MSSLEYNGKPYPLEAVISVFEESLTPERTARIREVIENRTRSVVMVLENIYDRGNASAVMRSCEAMGFQEVHMIEKGEKFKEANRVTKGADKWLDIAKWKSTTECIQHLKGRGYTILATHLEGAVPLDEIDFTKPTAIVMGNEKDGVSDELLAACDHRVVIPMQGFVQSYNISVASALCLYHALKNRENRLGRQGDLSTAEKRLLYGEYLVRAHQTPDAFLARHFAE